MAMRCGAVWPGLAWHDVARRGWQQRGGNDGNNVGSGRHGKQDGKTFWLETKDYKHIFGTSQTQIQGCKAVDRPCAMCHGTNSNRKAFSRLNSILARSSTVFCGYHRSVALGVCVASTAESAAIGPAGLLPIAIANYGLSKARHHGSHGL